MSGLAYCRRESRLLVLCPALGEWDLKDFASLAAMLPA